MMGEQLGRTRLDVSAGQHWRTQEQGLKNNMPTIDHRKMEAGVLVGLFGQYLKFVWMVTAFDVAGLKKYQSLDGTLLKYRYIDALPQREWTTPLQNDQGHDANATTKRNLSRLAERLQHADRIKIIIS